MFDGFYDFEPFDSSFNAESSPTPFRAHPAEFPDFDIEFNNFDNLDFNFLDQNDDPYFDSIFQQNIPSPQKSIPFLPKIKKSIRFSTKIKKPISPLIKRQNSQKPENRNSTVLMTFKPFESPLAGQKFVDAVRSILPNEKPNFV
jgi:hypothetical protein